MPIDAIPDGHSLRPSEPIRFGGLRPTSVVPSLNGYTPDLAVMNNGAQRILLRYFEQRSPQKPEGGLGVEAVLKPGMVIPHRISGGAPFVVPNDFRIEGMQLTNGDTANRSGILLLTTSTEIVALSGLLSLTERGEAPLRVAARVRYDRPIPYLGMSQASNRNVAFAGDDSPTIQLNGRPRVIAQINDGNSLDPALILVDRDGFILLKMVERNTQLSTFVVHHRLAFYTSEGTCAGGVTVSAERSVDGWEMIASVGSRRHDRSSVWLRGPVNRWVNTSNGTRYVGTQQALLGLSVVRQDNYDGSGTVSALTFTGYAGEGGAFHYRSTGTLTRLLSSLGKKAHAGVLAGRFLGSFRVTGAAPDGGIGVVALFQLGDDVWTYQLPEDPLQSMTDEETCSSTRPVSLNTIVGRGAGLNGQGRDRLLENRNHRFVALQTSSDVDGFGYDLGVLLVSIRSERPGANSIHFSSNEPRGDVFMVQPVQRYTASASVSRSAGSLYGPRLMSSRSAATRCGSTRKVCHDGLLDGWLPGVLDDKQLMIRRRGNTDAMLFWNHATGAAQRSINIGGAR